MHILTRRAATAVGAIAAAGSVMVFAPAQAATPAPSTVTVHNSDSTPAVGQQFRLSGAVISGGVRVPATVRVKTLQNGKWVQLRGAVEATNRQNRYNIGVVLSLKGKRMLRVVGTPKSASIAVARNTFPVTVH